MGFIVRKLLHRHRTRRFRLGRGCWWPSRELDEKLSSYPGDLVLVVQMEERHRKLLLGVGRRVRASV